MADETPVDSKPAPTASEDVTAIKAENIALKKMLDEHKTRLEALADADQKLKSQGGQFDAYRSFALEQYKAQFEAAPEAVKAHFKDLDPSPDPLAALQNLNGFNKFVSEIETSVKEKYGIKEAATDPTRRPPEAQADGIPDFSSHQKIAAFIAAKYKDK